MPEQDFSNSINCCSAKNWKELGRECLDSTQRPILNRVGNKKTDRIPALTWKGYNSKQHWTDILKRDYIRHTVI